MFKFRLLCVVILCAAAAVSEQPDKIVTWSATLVSGHSASGKKTGTVVLTARIQPGWHLYSISQPAGGPIATQIVIPADQGFRQSGPVTGPKPDVKFDPNFGMNAETYSHSAQFQVPVEISALKKGMVDVRFQACTERLCMPPRTEHVAVSLKPGSVGHPLQTPGPK